MNYLGVEQVPLTEDEEFYWDRHRKCCLLYARLRRVGLTEFEPGGKGYGYDKHVTLNTMIDHFNELEWYERSAYLKKLLS